MGLLLSGGQEPAPTDRTHTDPTAGGPDHAQLPLPTTGREIEAFVAAVKAMADAPAHGDNATKAGDHASLLKLVPRTEATHVAVANGDWFDPATWHRGRIPAEGAKVLIPEGVSVTYDGESSQSLFTVRVDGDLSFATSVDTSMTVDTMIVAPSGRLDVGTDGDPIDDGVTARILIADNGNINTGWDAKLLSRGLISHGEVEIRGAEKTAFTKIQQEAMAGDTVLDLAGIPKGWQVGDTLVVSGTHKEGWTWDNKQRATVYKESQDEEVTISAIDGDKVTLDRALKFDHDVPRADLSAYVANLSRSITIASENGPDTDAQQRGHVMFMHSGKVDVRYAAFDDLGRTDKSAPAFDVAALSRTNADSNVQGRYPVHFHQSGTDDPDNPAIAVGNAVNGSPGWGFVHHSSNADFYDNVAFDVFGAAFVAEKGDETGVWRGNMAIRTEGIGYGAKVKQVEDLRRHDTGRTGDGFFFAGRLVEAADNVAANTTHGYVWMHRGAEGKPLASNFDHSEIAYGDTYLKPGTPPIVGFQDNEAFGTAVGLIILKASPNQGHDIRTVLDGFLNWETAKGAGISYTAHYTLKDFDLIGTRNAAPVARADTAFEIGANAFDFAVNGMRIAGFKSGIDVGQRFTFPVKDSDVGHTFIDVLMQDVDSAYLGLNGKRHRIMSSNQLNDDPLSFVHTAPKTISLGDNLHLDGMKSDSIGRVSRIFAQDDNTVSWSQLKTLLQTDGYYRTAEGRKVMVVPDFVADRANGTIMQFNHVITLDIADDRLGRIGARDMGRFDLNGDAKAVQYFPGSAAAAGQTDPGAVDHQGVTPAVVDFAKLFGDVDAGASIGTRLDGTADTLPGSPFLDGTQGQPRDLDGIMQMLRGETTIADAAAGSDGHASMFFVSQARQDAIRAGDAPQPPSAMQQEERPGPGVSADDGTGALSSGSREPALFADAFIFADGATVAGPPAVTSGQGDSDPLTRGILLDDLGEDWPVANAQGAGQDDAADPAGQDSGGDGGGRWTWEGLIAPSGLLADGPQDVFTL